MAEVRQDCPLVDGDACCREEAAVFGLRDEGAHDRDAGRVGGDWVVDGVVGEEGRRVVAHVMGRASDGPSSGTGEVGRVRMDAKNHLGSPIDFAPIRMGRDEAEETVKAGHGGEGGGDLFAGERTGGGEDARVYTPPVVEEVAHRDLQFLDLGRGGWGGEVRPGGGLGGPGTIGGGGVEGRGRGGADSIGTKTGKEGGDIARVG